MKVLFNILLLATLLSIAVSHAAGEEFYITVEIESRSDIERLTRIVSIDNRDELTVYAYATDEQLVSLEENGYSYTILPHPSTLYTPRMSPSAKGEQAWDYYPTYTEYVDSMAQYAIDFPALCQTYDIGSTVNGRSLLYLKISDNVDLQEDEPEVLYVSSIHGNETTGYILMLRLISYLLNNYGSDSLVTRLVDSCEIWINPLVNPDGTYRSGDHTVTGATRLNANNVDLNRNFPDPEDGDHPDGFAWQPETVAMMNFADSHTFVISANLHGGAEVINYPWDTWSRRHPDDLWYIDISRTYADSAQYYSPPGYLTDLQNGITNGYDWYTISGGRQDFMNFWHGCREVTMEISETKLLPEDSLGEYWNYNKASLMDYMENALYGIRGIVTSSSTSQPLAATVRVVDYDREIDNSRIFTDPDVGDYHRMLPDGTYDLIFKSTGYYPDTVFNIVVTQKSATRVDVQLDPLPFIPDLAFVAHDAYQVNPGDTVMMKIILENLGASDAVNVLAALETDDPFIGITQSLSSYADIPALGGMQNSVSAFEFHASTVCPWSHLTAFELIVSADGGYLDTVSFSLDIGLFVEDFESGDLSRMPWQPGGSPPWGVVTGNPFTGIYSAKSGDIGDGGFSWMTLDLDIVRGGMLQFKYKVSSEPYDYFEFYVDGVDSGQWSGELDWSAAQFYLDSGQHALTWLYRKDPSFAGGNDCAWVDSIAFPPIRSKVTISDSFIPDWTAGYDFLQQLEADSGVGALTWTDRDNNLAGTGLMLASDGQLQGNPSSAGEYVFVARVVDQGGGEDEKSFSFTINPGIEIITASLPDGGVGSNYLLQLEASGGTGPLSWSDKNGELIGTGLSLSPDGLLAGIPGAVGTVNLAVLVQDSIGSSAEAVYVFDIKEVTYICGDASGDQSVNIGDVVFLNYHIFKDGPPPDPLEAGNANCDDSVNVGDAVYLLNYIFHHGSAPCCP